MAAKVAFYAPLKSPDHPIPSGDREIARLMMRALGIAGYDVSLISEVISYQKRPAAELYDKRRSDVTAERTRIERLWRDDPPSIPDLWFTYHPYCKSPDWLGSPLCRQFGIPYVTAEACRTRQGGPADWLEGRAATQEAVRQAAANFVLKDSDWQYLETFLPDMSAAVRIPPFLDMSALPPVGETGAAADVPRLLAAGMMRPGAKMRSYTLLAEALAKLEDASWTLTVAGEGPERDVIERFPVFADPGRVEFRGSVAHEDMFTLFDESDVFIWPGIGEAIGLVYLEAQARGLPVVAFETAGVPLVVANDVGGLLVPEDDTGAFAEALAGLLKEPQLRARLGQRGQQYVRDHHDVPAVAAIFKTTLDPLIMRNQ
ncbi:glycosyltransferase family 4 protein [Nitratireductor sp. XY-223]|uniref:glycosyltransferase family 4 protein n=1 Tax=Nitratireductor sp. XY-223 TaxID=2561926 RepID=UPI0010A9F97A|nr:glycosyltransferase family 4 protein [Nitratireductor sp. XY-223]